MTGEKQAALADLNRGLAIAPNSPGLRYRAALVYNQLGETDLTLQWLTRALAVGFSPVTVRDAPEFDSFRGKPKFKQLLQGR